MAELQISPAPRASQASKPCSRCGQMLPATVEHFSPIKTRGKLHSWCKPCCAANRKETRAANPEHHRKILRDCYARNGDAMRERNRARWPEYAVAHADKIKARQQERRDQYNAARRTRLASDDEARQRAHAVHRAWFDANADVARARRREKWKAATPTQRLRSNLGSAIYHALKGTGKGGRSWQDLVGYTAADLKAHLERQFLKGMTWDNYGQWHVDHIIPASSFRYTHPSDPDFLACWAMTNLRPLWAADNVRKRHHRTHLI